MLSPEQEIAFTAIKNGKNVMIQGCGGCGKSYLIKFIVDWARKNGKHCFTTALTGLAAANLNNSEIVVCATTFHSWLGCGLAKPSATELIKKIGLRGKLNIKSADMLIIDEISMMSADLFDKTHMITCALRNCQRLFGGIQVICVGDLYQLPPVAGDLVCTSPNFKTLELIELKTIFRQRDHVLIDLLQKIRSGHIDEKTIELLERLDRPTKTTNPVILKTTRSGVDEINELNLDGLKSEANPIKVFTAEDGPNTWSGRILDELTVAPRIIYLCRGARVMLIRNINDTLHNGSFGEIMNFDQNDGSPIVKFDCGIITKVEPISWDVCDPKNYKKIIASRYQVPLILGYAMTIHKSQGQTISNLDVDLYGIFERGMTYVALSRCVSLEGLRVRNFSGVLLQPNPLVVEYLNPSAHQQDAQVLNKEPHA